MILTEQLPFSATGAPALGDDPRPWDLLGVWLALEVKQPDSPWRAYLDALPVRLDDLPMFRPAEDLALLEGTAAYAFAAEINRDVSDKFDRLSPDLRAGLSLADFAWGRAIVMSRGFYEPGTFDEQMSLLPLVDIFNHGRTDTSWSYNPLDGLVLRTQRTIEAGGEVHFSYGERSNMHLLVHFGFTLEDNAANDEAEVVFELPPRAPIRAHVRAAFDHRFARALSLARVHACEPAERERILDDLTRPTNIGFLGRATEEAALDLIATSTRAARDRLAACTVPAHPDHAWERSCVAVRDGERAVLDQLVELATIAREYALEAELAELDAAAGAIPADAAGARGILRRYLQARADELTDASAD